MKRQIKRSALKKTSVERNRQAGWVSETKTAPLACCKPGRLICYWQTELLNLFWVSPRGECKLPFWQLYKEMLGHSKGIMKWENNNMIDLNDKMLEQWSYEGPLVQLKRPPFHLILFKSMFIISRFIFRITRSWQVPCVTAAMSLSIDLKHNWNSLICYLLLRKRNQPFGCWGYANCSTAYS